MTRAVDVSGRGVRAEGRGVGVGTGIPDSEGFEHNNLAGNYGGDLSAFNIQSTVVQEGSYALDGGDGEGNHEVIVRDTNQDRWGPPIRMTWKQYIPGAGGDGGIAWACQSVTGKSSFSGYWIFSDSPDTLRIDKVTNGTNNSLTSTSSASITENTWIDGQLDWLNDGSMTVTLDGNTVSTTDTEYSDGFLGIESYRQLQYMDRIEFQRL